MRGRTFLELVSQYPRLADMRELASQKVVEGGWEVWLQVELARHIKRCREGNHLFVREQRYPQIQRMPRNQEEQELLAGTNKYCDFYAAIDRGRAGLYDETYIELKCINPCDPNPCASALRRFGDDINKVKELRKIYERFGALWPNACCALVYYGSVQSVIEACSIVSEIGILYFSQDLKQYKICSLGEADKNYSGLSVLAIEP